VKAEQSPENSNAALTWVDWQSAAPVVRRTSYALTTRGASNQAFTDNAAHRYVVADNVKDERVSMHQECCKMHE
jgi:hypothetical protein